MLLRTLLAGVLLLPLVAAAENSTPARFIAGEDGLAAHIEFPEVRGDGAVRIRCAAMVAKDGDLKKNGCYLEKSDQSLFIAATNKAAKKARMIPATIDGKNRQVYLQYLVDFVAKGDSKTVAVYNNLAVAENVEAYGEDHVAAQRAVGKEEWQDICPQHMRFSVWVKAHVGSSGTASNASIAANNGPPITEKCQLSIIATIEQSRFAPAMAGDEAVPSTYMEPFGN